MSYANQDDLIREFGEDMILQRADRDGDGAIDADVMQQALNAADALINNALKHRYQVPVSPTPEVLAVYARDIAYYRLHGAQPTDDAIRRYREALAWLEQIRKGERDLNGATPLPAGGGVDFVAPDPVFTQTTLADYWCWT